MTRHTFDSIAFDFSVASGSHAENVLDRLSAFWSTEMEPIIETSIDDTIGPAGDLVLDSLVLDLGDLPDIGMETALAERFAASLRAEFSRAARRPRAGTTGEHPDTARDKPPASSLRALETYLLTGNLPPESVARGVSMDSLLAEALDTAPDRLMALLREIMREHRPRRRVLLQSLPDTRERLIRLLAGSQFARLEGFRTEIFKHHGHDLPGRGPDANVENSVQAALLTEFLKAAASDGVDHRLFQSLAAALRLDPIPHAAVPPDRPPPPDRSPPDSFVQMPGPGPIGPNTPGSTSDAPPDAGPPTPAPMAPTPDPGFTGLYTLDLGTGKRPDTGEVTPYASAPAPETPPGTGAPAPDTFAPPSHEDETTPHTSDTAPDMPLGTAAPPPAPRAPSSDPGQTSPHPPDLPPDAPPSPTAPTSAPLPPATDTRPVAPHPPKRAPDAPTGPGAPDQSPFAPPSDQAQTGPHAPDLPPDAPPSPTAPTSAPFPRAADTRSAAPHPPKRAPDAPTGPGAPNQSPFAPPSDPAQTGPHAPDPVADVPSSTGAPPAAPLAPMPDPGGSDALAPDSATVAASEPIYADFLGLMRHNPLPSDRLSEVDMAAWFRVLFNSQGDRLIHDLRALPDPQATATAVLRHLPWTALEALIVGLNPAMGGFVITMLLAGEKAALRRKEQSRHTLQNALWHAALSLTLDPRGPKGDATAVAGRVVTSAARHGAINTDEILHALREGAHAGAAQDARFHPLEEILPALRGAMPSGGHSDTRSTHRPAVQTSGPSASAIPRQTHAATNQKQEYDLAPPASTIPSDPLSVAIAYLRYGTLPAGETKSDICKRIEAVIAAALGAGSSAQLSWLLPLLTVPLHRFRLMQCISTAVAMDLMDQVRPDGRRVMRLLDELAPLVCESLPGLTLDEWTSIALSIALGPPPDAAEPDTGFLRNALQTASAKRSLLYADTIAALAAHGGAIQGLSSNARDAIAGLVVPIAEESQSDPGATPPVIADAALDGLRTAAPDRLHVDNAGLVLLWPYLPRLFSTLHLLDDHGFCHTESQLRAVHLTQLLVSGDHSTPEHMLPLNKLLCGLGLTHPVGLDITPTPKETDLVHDLLYSVTQTWEPLRNTTIEGLRESFLIRNGLLQRTSPAAPMTLSVETRAFDMLLDRLPWSLSVIKLHWMSEELHVRWR